MQESQLQLWEDLIEMRMDFDRMSKRIGKIAERFSKMVEPGQPAHNRQSAPCLHVESLFVNKAGFDECRICGHVFRN